LRVPDLQKFLTVPSDDDDFHPVRRIVLLAPAEEFLPGLPWCIPVECLEGAHVETGEGMILVDLRHGPVTPHGASDRFDRFPHQKHWKKEIQLSTFQENKEDYTLLEMQMTSILDSTNFSNSSFSRSRARVELLSSCAA
jgi:hypothetical protein